MNQLKNKSSVLEEDVDLENEDPTTHKKILEIFAKNNTPYTLTTHEPVLTSEQAAEVRKFPLSTGAKAILVHMIKDKEESYNFFVMSGVKKISWPKVKKFLGSKTLRFARLPEVKLITGCLTGAVPPFGSVFQGGLKTHVDPSLKNQSEIITFNVGLRTHSIVMNYEDWAKVENPTVVDFVDDK